MKNEKSYLKTPVFAGLNRSIFMQKLADCCIFFLPGIATQSICADILGILEEILSYGIGGVFTPLNSMTIQAGCARHGRVYNVFLHEPFFVDFLNRVVLWGKPVD
ncbi:MAG: hypothetical protein V3T59_06825 [Desulfobacterales bacterium]